MTYVRDGKEDDLTQHEPGHVAPQRAERHGRSASTLTRHESMLLERRVDRREAAT